ncbi:hypothetical protein llap_11554 [Limosa lapponica baueri]|uniref:Uncharacterized protein n=1 Tax=Limosa lapponica baueri TaxID=1758121 RepID=A0A2I0TWQ5_LIMLA|nr:hypothetical protein llap_11554 [Limosa lapponica baueri]
MLCRGANAMPKPRVHLCRQPDIVPNRYRSANPPLTVTPPPSLPVRLPQPRPQAEPRGLCQPPQPLRGPLGAPLTFPTAASCPGI